MSTEIRSINSKSDWKITLSGGREGEAYVGIGTEGHLGAGLRVGLANLLSAVEAEYGGRLVPADAIVISRAGLPPVTLTGTGSWATVSAGLPDDVHSVHAFRRDFTPEEAMQMARAWVAIAEHITGHPPVDEAQVAAVAAVLGDFAIYDDGGFRDDAVLARRLVERGVRVEGA